MEYELTQLSDETMTLMVVSCCQSNQTLKTPWLECGKGRDQMKWPLTSESSKDLYEKGPGHPVPPKELFVALYFRRMMIAE